MQKLGTLGRLFTSGPYRHYFYLLKYEVRKPFVSTRAE